MTPPLTGLKQFKNQILGKSSNDQQQEAMKARINDICNALNEVLKVKDCTLNEALMSFQAIQNGLTAVVQAKKVSEIQS